MAEPSSDRVANPPPLTVAASLVGVQGVVILALAVVEAFSVVDDRRSVGISVAVFFAVYGTLLVVCAVALTRRAGWARGPALLSQLIQLGIAWNLRDTPFLAIMLVVAALVALAGMLSPASIDVLMPRADDDAED